MRSLPEGLLGKFSSLLKKKKTKRSVSGIWMLLGKNVMLKVVIMMGLARGKGNMLQMAFFHTSRME